MQKISLKVEKIPEKSWAIINLIIYCPKLFWLGKNSILQHAQNYKINDNIMEYLKTNDRDALTKYTRMLFSGLQPCEYPIRCNESFGINFPIDVNLPINHYGATLLFLAIEKEHDVLIQILVENGADVNAKKIILDVKFAKMIKNYKCSGTTTFKTPLELAEEKSNQDIISILNQTKINQQH